MVENPWYIDNGLYALSAEARSAKEQLDESTPQNVDEKLIRMWENLGFNVDKYKETGQLYDRDGKLVYQHWSVDDLSELSNAEKNLEDELTDAYSDDFTYNAE